MTYWRSITFLMCSAMVASVPMPFLSIRFTRSASVSRFGRVVLPCFTSQELGRKRCCAVYCGIHLSLHFSYTNTSR